MVYFKERNDGVYIFAYINSGVSGPKFTKFTHDVSSFFLSTHILETFPHDVALAPKEVLLCRFPESAL